MKVLRKLLVLGLVAPATGCGAGTPSSEDAAAAVRAADSALSEAVKARDVERVLQFYASDATLLPAASPLIAGRDSIRAEWVELFAIPSFSGTPRLLQVEVAASGDLAFTRGSFETLLTGQDGKPVTEIGKWVTIWRKQADGSWRIVVDIYNTDTPPPDHI